MTGEGAINLKKTSVIFWFSYITFLIKKENLKKRVVQKVPDNLPTPKIWKNNISVKSYM